MTVKPQPPRILFLTQYFPPETGAPQARISEMAHRLAQKGFEVQILTAMPNYPRGKIFPGYRGRLWKIEKLGELRVIRTAIFPTKSPRTVLRLTNYFSFVFSSAFLGLFLVRRPDIIVTESPPLFLGLSGMFMKLMLRCRLIFNVSDLWPESAVRMGLYKDGLAVRLATALEKLCYRRANAVTGQSAGIIRGVLAKHPQAKTAHVPNGCDCDVFGPANRDAALRTEWGAAEKLVIGYAGLIGLAQGVRLIVELADRFRHDSRVLFVIVGDGPDLEDIRREARERQLENIRIAGLVPKDQMPAIVATFDATVIPLRYFIPGALPSKVYEAMASQVPIILAAEGDARELIERAQAGIIVDYNSLDSSAAAVCRLVDDPAERTRLGRNGREYVLRYHDRRQIAEKMEKVVLATLRGDHQFFADEAVQWGIP